MLNLVYFCIALAEINYHLISEASVTLSNRINSFCLFPLVCRPMIILFTADLCNIWCVHIFLPRE